MRMLHNEEELVKYRMLPSSLDYATEGVKVSMESVGLLFSNHTTTNTTLPNSTAEIDPDADTAANHNRYLSLLLIVMPIIGFAGNLMVIIAVKTVKELTRSKTNIILSSLASADLLVCLLVMPPSIIQQVLGKWIFGDFACSLYIFLDVCLCTSSILHMCAISLDRYICVSVPMHFSQWNTKKATSIKIVVVWLVAVVIACPVLVNASLDLDFIYVNSICVINNLYFQIYGSLLAFFFPFTLMGVSYIFTTKKLKEKNKHNYTGKLRRAQGTYSKGVKHSMDKFSHNTPQNFNSSFSNGTDYQTHNCSSQPTTAAATPYNGSQLLLAYNGSKQHQPYTSSLLTSSMLQSPYNSGKVRRNQYDKVKYPSSDNEPSSSSSANSPIQWDLQSPNKMQLTRAEVRKQYVGRKLSYDSFAPITKQEVANCKLDVERMPQIDDSTNSTTNSKTERSPKPMRKPPRQTKNAVTILRNKWQTTRKDSKQLDKEKKATQVLRLVFLAFVLCWSPFFFLNIITAICTLYGKECVPYPFIMDFALWLGYIESIVNPIIYTIINKNFQKAFKDMLRCRLERNPRRQRAASVAAGMTKVNNNIVVVAASMGASNKLYLTRQMGAKLVKAASAQ